jgi:hypothetical protein
MEAGSSQTDVASAVYEVLEKMGRMGVRLAEDVQVRAVESSTTNKHRMPSLRDLFDMSCYYAV